MWARSGRELQPLGGLHEDGSLNSSVQPREALVANNLAEAVDHAVVGLLTSSGRALELDSCLYDV